MLNLIWNIILSVICGNLFRCDDRLWQLFREALRFFLKKCQKLYDMNFSQSTGITRKSESTISLTPSSVLHNAIMKTELFFWY